MSASLFSFLRRLFSGQRELPRDPEEEAYWNDPANRHWARPMSMTEYERVVAELEIAEDNLAILGRELNELVQLTPEQYQHLEVVRGEVAKAQRGEDADLSLVAQFLAELQMLGQVPFRERVAQARKALLADDDGLMLRYLGTGRAE